MLGCPMKDVKCSCQMTRLLSYPMIDLVSRSVGYRVIRQPNLTSFIGHPTFDITSTLRKRVLQQFQLRRGVHGFAIECITHETQTLPAGCPVLLDSLRIEAGVLDRSSERYVVGRLRTRRGAARADPAGFEMGRLEPTRSCPCRLPRSAGLENIFQARVRRDHDGV